MFANAFLAGGDSHTFVEAQAWHTPLHICAGVMDVWYIEIHGKCTTVTCTNQMGKSTEPDISSLYTLLHFSTFPYIGASRGFFPAHAHKYMVQRCRLPVEHRIRSSPKPEYPRAVVASPSEP